MELDNKIEGWLSVYEGMMLSSLASRCKLGCIVQIGCFKGRSLDYILQGNPSVNVYGIDIEQQVELNISKFNFILGNSTNNSISQLITEPIELLFIDGAHDYESVKLDIITWVPKVLNGGIIIFHDAYPTGSGITWEPGVKQAIQEYLNTCKQSDFVYDSWFSSSIHSCDTMCIMQKMG